MVEATLAAFSTRRLSPNMPAHPRSGASVCVFAGLALVSFPAWAIPAPDLVVNVLASLAQLAGLAAAGLGALAARLRWVSGAATAGRSWPRWLPAVLALLMVVLLVGNLAQCAHHLDVQSQRLEANLWRKTSDWDRRFDAPHISTEALAAKMAAGAPLRIVDVREPEEFEVAHFAQAEHRRYADLLLNPAQVQPSDASLVFVCDSGKRSGEVCEHYRKLGIDCAVLEGGYPRWAREGRPLWLASSRWRARFEPLPRFPGDTTLLDTAQVSRLVADDSAAFLDVRSPAEFERGHLANAVNLPMRGLGTPALEQAIQALPRQPYVPVCYDNRSCFHAKVLSLKLQRLGHDMRGRYTLPHEFPVPERVGERSLVARVQASLTRLADRVVKPVARGLHWAGQQVGSLALVLMLLLLATRLPFGPVATKAARDRVQKRADAEHLGWLRAHYAGDEFRLQRALARWRQTRHQTPWRNLGISLLQLALFALCFAAVGRAAQWSDESLAWMPRLSEPDPLGVLAVAVAALSWAVLRHLRLGESAIGRLGSWVGQAALALFLGYATTPLPAAVALYLAASLALLCVQQQWHGWRKALWRLLRSWGWQRQARANGRLCMPFSRAEDLAQVGGKALRLGQLQRAGLAVPAGWVVPCRALERLAQDGSELAQAIEQAVARSSAHLFAVRSSAGVEDGTAQSHAGLFETRLRVPRGELLQAVQAVSASYSAAAGSGAGVVIQEMIEAEHAGVLFTQSPAHAGAMLVECVAGTGDALVSGNATPPSFLYGRLTHKPLAAADAPAPPIHFAPLLATACEVEQLLGRPQDIEWAYKDGRFWLLQSRDITARLRGGTAQHQVIEAERERVIAWVRPLGVPAGEVLFEQTDLSADLPQPTAMSLSLMQRVRGEGGSTDRAMQALGISFKASHDTPSEVQTVWGHTFVLRWPAWRRGQSMAAVAAFVLSRRAKALEDDFEHRFLPGFLSEASWRDAVDFDRLSDQALLDTLSLWVDRFVMHEYVQAEVINIAADFYVQTAHRALQKKGLQLGPLMRAPGAIFEDVSLRSHGHRCAHDWELAEPRFDEDSAAWQTWRNALPPSRSSQAEPQQPAVNSGVTAALLARAQRYVGLKERAKHECLRSLRSLRRLLLAIDRRYGLGGRVFDLRLDELVALPERAQALREVAQRRHAQRAQWAALSLPALLRLEDIETLLDPAFNPSASPLPPAQHGVLRGSWVSGAAALTGRVRLLQNPADVHHLMPGEIAVMQLASPQWVGALPVAAGLVTAVGGQLAHLALLAREHGLPAIFGAAGAMQVLRTGDKVTLYPEGWVQTHAD